MIGTKDNLSPHAHQNYKNTSKFQSEPFFNLQPAPAGVYAPFRLLVPVSTLRIPVFRGMPRADHVVHIRLSSAKPDRSIPRYIKPVNAVYKPGNKYTNQAAQKLFIGAACNLYYKRPEATFMKHLLPIKPIVVRKSHRSIIYPSCHTSAS